MYEKRDLSLQGANHRIKQLETEVAQLRDDARSLQSENEKLQLQLAELLKKFTHLTAR